MKHAVMELYISVCDWDSWKHCCIPSPCRAIPQLNLATVSSIFSIFYFFLDFSQTPEANEKGSKKFS